MSDPPKRRGVFMSDDERALSSRHPRTATPIRGVRARTPPIGVPAYVSDMPSQATSIPDEDPPDFEVDEVTPLEAFTDGVDDPHVRRVIEFLWRRVSVIQRAANTVLRAEAKRASRDKWTARIGKLALGLVIPALLAAITALYAAGIQAGSKSAAEARSAEDRIRLERCEQTNQKQDVDIGNLRGHLRIRRPAPPGQGDDTP